MPGGNRTGPLGMGPMTGRGAGFCAGFAAPAFMKSMGAYGIGRGYGRGFRRMYGFMGFPNYGGAYTPELRATEEKEFLNNQVNFLENQLLQVQKRLQELAGDAE